MKLSVVKTTEYVKEMMNEAFQRALETFKNKIKSKDLQ